MRGTSEKDRDRGQSEFRQVGDTEKRSCFGDYLDARPCHRQPVCRCYTEQKVPVAHDLEQLDNGCQGSPWNGQVAEKYI